MPPFHILNSTVYVNSFLTSNSNSLSALFFLHWYHIVWFPLDLENILISGWVSFLSLLFFSLFFFLKHFYHCIYLTLQEKLRVFLIYISKPTWDGIKCIDYLGDSFHLYSVESFSSGIGMLSTYSRPLLCSSRRFCHFSNIVFVMLISRYFLFIVAILRPPCLPHYVILSIVDI